MVGRATLLAGHVVRGGGRNTPTLVNAALQPRSFDDGRVRTLEDQATDVLGSAAEMGARSISRRERSAWDAIQCVSRSPRMCGSLVALNSRFDRAGALVRSLC
jgi:cytochrome c peroxidase